MQNAIYTVRSSWTLANNAVSSVPTAPYASTMVPYGEPISTKVFRHTWWQIMTANLQSNHILCSYTEAVCIEAQGFPHLRRSSSKHGVEDMIVPLLWQLWTDPGPFQQVVRHIATDHIKLESNHQISCWLSNIFSYTGTKCQSIMKTYVLYLVSAKHSTIRMLTHTLMVKKETFTHTLLLKWISTNFPNLLLLLFLIVLALPNDSSSGFATKM